MIPTSSPEHCCLKRQSLRNGSSIEIFARRAGGCYKFYVLLYQGARRRSQTHLVVHQHLGVGPLLVSSVPEEIAEASKCDIVTVEIGGNCCVHITATNSFGSGQERLAGAVLQIEKL